ncbi:MAG: 50S ribosomal protein L22 [Candidatus Taylorbacteria bacterium]|nr:50S ribosomal protein L22 [Candidatus Taylorbacteria bacterium]
MEVTAKLNNLRIAPRKIRAVSNLIKGKNVNTALDQLEYFVRKPVRPIKKLLNSAIANAENNFNMVKENLYIKELIVNEGIKLKRFRAKGFGRAAAIQKKTSHIKLVLDERTPGLRTDKKARIKKEAVEETVRETKLHEDKKPEIKRELGQKRNLFGNLGKRLFQRKAI